MTPPAAATGAAVAKGAVPAKTPTKTASVCKGLDENGCKGNTECGWIVPTKLDPKSGKADKAYCRKIAGVAKKAADAKKAVVDTAGKVGTTVKNAVTPAAPAATPSAPAAKKP